MPWRGAGKPASTPAGAGTEQGVGHPRPRPAPRALLGPSPDPRPPRPAGRRSLLKPSTGRPDDHRSHAARPGGGCVFRREGFLCRFHLTGVALLPASKAGVKRALCPRCSRDSAEHPCIQKGRTAAPPAADMFLLVRGAGAAEERGRVLAFGVAGPGGAPDLRCSPTPSSTPVARPAERRHPGAPWGRPRTWWPNLGAERGRLLRPQNARARPLWDSAEQAAGLSRLPCLSAAVQCGHTSATGPSHARPPGSLRVSGTERRDWLPLRRAPSRGTDRSGQGCGCQTPVPALRGLGASRLPLHAQRGPWAPPPGAQPPGPSRYPCA